MSGSSQIAMSSSHEPSAAAGGSSGGGGGPMLAGGDTVEQIALTLLRLQQDMYNVLIRLQSLETLTQQQVSHFLLYFFSVTLILCGHARCLVCLQLNAFSSS